ETKRRFFGPATREAVRKFQERHGLKVTGEVDDSTTSLLDTSNSSPVAATAIAPGAVVPIAQAASRVADVAARPPAEEAAVRLELERHGVCLVRGRRSAKRARTRNRS